MNSILIWIGHILFMFSLTIWFSQKLSLKDKNCSKKLLISLLFTYFSLLCLTYLTVRGGYFSTVADTITGVILFLCFYLSFLFMDMSIFDKKLKDNLLHKVFRKKLILAARRSLIILLLIILTFIVLINRDITLRTFMRMKAFFLILSALLFSGMSSINILSLFSYQRGAINFRFYHYSIAIMVSLFFIMGLFTGLGFAEPYPFIIFLPIYIVYSIRLFHVFLFDRITGFKNSLNEYVWREENTKQILREAISCPVNQDLRLFQKVLQNTYEKLTEPSLLKDFNFTGMMYYRRKGQHLRVETKDWIMGVCSPLVNTENLKNLHRNDVTRLILRQSFNVKKIRDTDKIKLKNFGQTVIKQILDRKQDLLINPPPAYMESYQSLVYALPVFNGTRLEGLIVLFKTKSNRIMPGEIQRLDLLAGNLELLATIFNGKETQLERNRLQGEMALADKIQNSIIPRKINIPGFESSAFMEAATEVGGDAYDIFNSDTSFLGIGDVSGHGLPAGITALISMSAFQASMETIKKYEITPLAHEVYEVVNKVLCTIKRDRMGSDRFMTQNFFHFEKDRVSFAGSHEIALIYRNRKAAVEQVNETVNGTAFMGLSEFIETSNSQGEFFLESGDILVLYTDGVIEARNEFKDQYGLERLKTQIELHCEKKAEEIIRNIRDNVVQFALNGDMKSFSGRFADDFSMIVLKKL